MSTIAFGLSGIFLTSLIGVISSLLTADLWSQSGVTSIFNAIQLVSMLLIFLGQFLSLFTPVSRTTKGKAGIFLLAYLLAAAILKLSPLTSTCLLFIALLAYLSFFYGLCQDLDSPQLTRAFNSAALLGMIGVSAYVIDLARVLMNSTAQPTISLVARIVLVTFLFLSFARFVQTVILLLIRACQLSQKGLTLPMSANLKSISSNQVEN